MEVGLSLPIKLSGEEKENFVVDAKSIGIKSIWVGDNPPINNAFLDIGRLLRGIQDIEFWTGITSPFYYSVEVLFALSIWFSNNFPNRFGLGLGVGNLDVVKDKIIKEKPFTSFTNYVNNLLNIVDIRKNQFNIHDFPSLAIGGLGKNMLQFACEKGDYLLLNSISTFDIERAQDTINQYSFSEEKTIQIIPYGMMQIISEKEEMSLTMWNIAKDIAKGCSTAILRKHGYSSQEINKIRDLSWDRYSIVPKGEIRNIVNDFGIIGTLEEVLERFENIKLHRNASNIKRLVLGWIHTDTQWDNLKEIINQLK